MRPPRFSNDELYENAVKFILKKGLASVSTLQKEFHIGYTQACRLVDTMEDDGILGPYSRFDSPRDILINMSDWTEKKEEIKRKRAENSGANQGSSSYRATDDANDPYAILGISKSALSDEIKSAYKKKVKEYHPDKVGGLGEKLRLLAEEEVKKINNAYQEIKKYRGIV